MEKILLGAVTIITTTALSTHAFAASQIFLDRATFLSSVGPVTVDADAPDFTAFGITNGPSATALTENFSNTMPGHELTFSGDENFNILFNALALPDPIFNFGLDFIEPSLKLFQAIAANGCNVPVCVDLTTEFTLLSGGSDLETLSFRPVTDSVQDAAVFFGFHSSVAFDGVRGREAVGSNDNEMFQKFTVGATAPAPLPAPAALLVARPAGSAAVARRKSA